MKLTLLAAFAATIACTTSASAQSIPANLSPTLKVGQTVVLKGVRAPTCGQTPPAFEALPGQPSSSLGNFSGGRVGTMNSRSCNGSTPAREVRFTAKKPGSETISVFGDSVTITVR
jgi:hypothetical protein